MSGDPHLETSCAEPQATVVNVIQPGNGTPQRALHRLSAVRRAKGISRLAMAEKLGIRVEELRACEEAFDLPISTLIRWAQALEVPVTELLVETDECLRPIHLARAQAARLLKAATRLRDRARRRGLQRLAQTFVDQLVEIQPAIEEESKHNHSRRNGKKPATPTPKQLPESIFTKNRHE